MDSHLEATLKRMDDLQIAFLAKLGEKIKELSRLILLLQATLSPQDKKNQPYLTQINQLSHSLAGSAGTFKHTDVYTKAKAIENLSHELLTSEADLIKSPQWYKFLIELISALRADVQVSGRPSIVENFSSLINLEEASQEEHAESKSQLNTVIVVDDDELLVTLIKEQAKHFNYHVVPLLSTENLETSIEKHQPVALLMDVIFPDAKHSGIEIINQLKSQQKIHCPVIFMSNRCDMEVRLDALRAGSNAFVVKPIEILELIRVLDRLTQKLSKKKSRILIVDDDENISEFYKLALQEQGFICEVLLNPLEIIKAALAFQPDTILLDINMPDCNGFEIAEVIRQDDNFAHIPILFLSSSNTSASEIQAMKSGGDDFLDKNNDLPTLIEIIKGHVDRYKELDAVLSRLKSDEVRFRSVTNSSNDAIISIDYKGRIIFWNEGAENIFGYHSLEVIGQSLNLIIPPDAQNNHPLNFKQLIKHKQSGLSISSLTESTVIKKDKTLIAVEATCTEWISGAEKIYTTIIRDIRTRKQMEQSLRNKENSFNAIVKSSSEGIITIDAKGFIETANPKTAEIFGYQQSELIGNNVSMLMPKNERKHHDGYLKRSDIHAPKVINKARDLEGLKKDGSVFALELNVSPMLMDDNQRKFVGILRDISERKHFVNELLEAKAEAESANEAKTQFLSSMSHELRTPLNAVLGFTQILQTDPDQPPTLDQLDSLEHIYNAGMQLLALITEILDLSRIESGASKLDLQEISLAPLIYNIIEQQKPLAAKTQISLNNLIAPDNVLSILADETKFNQIINNLLSNAIKYNQPQGSVDISLTTVEQKARLSITDTGIGIAEESLEQLFEPFNRLGQEVGTIEGVGIGLTITQKLVKMMHGNISVSSEQGKGTTFLVDFPLL